MQFCKKSGVYSTSNKLGSGHPKNATLQNKHGWNEIEEFKQHNIIKLAVTSLYSLFLEENGDVWCCGEIDKSSIYSDLTGIQQYIPKRIEYFTENGIKIKDIESGEAHSLALDTDGRVYAWGQNERNECGLISDRPLITTPTLIEELKEYVIESIICGTRHSVVITKCNKCFMFGDDWYGECMKNQIDGYSGNPIWRIDDMLKEKYDIKNIIEISLGYCNTKILCEI